jgi:hypothetical protein
VQTLSVPKKKPAILRSNLLLSWLETDRAAIYALLRCMNHANGLGETLVPLHCFISCFFDWQSSLSLFPHSRLTTALLRAHDR